MPAHPLIDLITSPEASVRNRPLEAWAASASLPELLEACAALDRFRRDAQNLYERVRALFFLSALHRFHLPPRLAEPGLEESGPTPGEAGLIPFAGFEHLLHRRFEEAIELLKPHHYPEETASSDWTCPKCGEDNPAGFEVCWNCGTEAAQQAPVVKS